MDEQRKYSIAEIDALRKAISERLSYREGSYKPSERAAEIEDMLRTHMLNGTSLEEMQSAVQETRDAYFARQKGQQEYYRQRQEAHSAKYPERPRPDGVMECLRIEDKRADAFNSGGFRCGNCREMQRADEFIVWVPSNVRMGERAVSIANASERFNGESSGWCVDCARKLTRKAG